MVTETRTSVFADRAAGEPLVREESYFAPAVEETSRHISWAAIVAGTATALGIQLILTMLGVWIAAVLVDTTVPPDPYRGIGIGAGLWAMISGLISFGVGGWLAAVISCRSGNCWACTHGVLVWALAAVLGAALATTTGAIVLGRPMNPVRTNSSLWGPGQAAFYQMGSSLSAPTNADSADMQVLAQRTAGMTARLAGWGAFSLLAGLTGAAVGGVFGGRSAPCIRGMHAVEPRTIPSV